jgi:hypothetical protein
MAAMIQTDLKIKIDSTLTLYVILENQMRRVKFSLKEQRGENSQTRAEWYLSRTAGMRLAMFLAGIREIVSTEREDDTPRLGRPRIKTDPGDD